MQQVLLSRERRPLPTSPDEKTSGKKQMRNTVTLTLETDAAVESLGAGNPDTRVRRARCASPVALSASSNNGGVKRSYSAADGSKFSAGNYLARRQSALKALLS